MPNYSKVTVRATEFLHRDIHVSVDAFDFLDGLKVDICGVPKNAYIDEEDGLVKTAEDVSHHGSPFYEYKTYDISENKKEILKEIAVLHDLLWKEK